MPIIQDTQQIRISAVKTDYSPTCRSESRSPKRLVTFAAEKIPQLPESMTDDGVVARRKITFRPEKVTITYEPHSRNDDEFSFLEVTVQGRNIRKDGSLGERAGSRKFFLMPEDDEEEFNRKLVMHRAAEYRVPDYLAELVELYDPAGEVHPFTAVPEVANGAD